MRRARGITEKPALDLIEETVSLLRRCPATVAALYYVGAAPFILGFLYFWTDMSRSAFAEDHLVESSLWMAIGYLWCKCWQALFAAHLLAAAAGRPLPRWTWRRLLRLATAQTAIQGTGLFVLPLAALTVLPLGFAFAFYQNCTVLALDGAGEPQGSAMLRREALAQARRWPGQNYLGLAVLFFFGLVVFANILIVILMLPSLLKTLLGIETMFTRSLWSMFNTTLFAAAAGITYLCVDPVIKAFYALRCFHGRSVATGEDLQVELRALASGAVQAGAAAVLLLLACTGRAGAAEPGKAPAGAAEIDRSITVVLNRPEFAWRAPREAVKAERKGPAANFMRGASKMLRRWMRPSRHAGERFFRWLGRRMMQRQGVQAGGGKAADWGALLKVFAWGSAGLIVCMLGAAGWKMWLRRSKPLEVAAAPLQRLPDLTAEDVAADQLPEDAWMRMAREMMERGDLRLALRAFYLAALAHLSERQMISIAKYKSNRDYHRELRRRRPGQAELIATFGETIRAFERAWYGMHEVTRDVLGASQRNLERIRQC